MPAGLVKQKKYDWEDSNMALFGSSTDRDVKKKSAETEKAWDGVLSIDSNCVRVWRVNQFELENVSRDEYGQFYNGDSYVVLKVRKNNDKLLYDVFFWIGQHSTQDEYATAAYKVVELDTLLDDRAVQHREVEGHETAAFKECFKTFTILQGGNKSGFKNVLPKEYKSRLFCIHIEGRTTSLTEVEYLRKSLKSQDVFIVDQGQSIIQWNGAESRPVERMKGAETVQTIKGSRNRCQSKVIDEIDRASNAPFISSIPDGDVTDSASSEPSLTPAIFRLSDASGSLKKTTVSEGKVARSMVDEDDVFLIQGTDSLFVYVGVQCSVDEKRNAIIYAHNHLREISRPCLPITVSTAYAASTEYENFWKL